MALRFLRRPPCGALRRLAAANANSARPRNDKADCARWHQSARVSQGEILRNA
jgi:hypothetical protein